MVYTSVPEKFFKYYFVYLKYLILYNLGMVCHRKNVIKVMRGDFRMKTLKTQIFFIASTNKLMLVIFIMTNV
jgi:hypothetical protein